MAARAPSSFTCSYSADPVGQRGDLDDAGVVLRPQPLECVIHDARVPVHEVALQAPDLGTPKRIERCPSQPTQPRKRPEGGLDPAAELQLPAQTETAQERRMEVVVDANGAGERRLGALLHARLEMRRLADHERLDPACGD
jgi:hypothetical protein